MRKQQERRSGRQWRVALVAAALGLALAGCSASADSSHEHEWEAATCETPRVCKTCGETDGEPLGHTWQEATCLAPKTCTVCGKTEGRKSEDHVWGEATCTEREIYTSLDTATEPVLDALAINWKVDWYDTGYSVEQKRRIIKTALTVRRLMGTVGAVKLQADAIYPGTMLEEWFEYGGQPGTFRLYINVTDTTEEHPAIIYSPAEMERRLITAKRWSAHLESLSYMVRHTLATGCRVDKWAYTVPVCGTIYCGVWWMPATLGYTAHHALLTGGQPGAFAVSPEFTGTLPVPATVGYSVCGALRSGGVAAGYTASPEFAGTLPEEVQHGN